MFAWTTVSMHFSEKTKHSKTTEIDVRYTGIWEKRGATWHIVHEHLSAPISN
jgi:ketosteroid isomerase-like protein